MTESFWQRPVIRGTETGHRQATWAELFFDLVFVVVVAQLASWLVGDVSWPGVGRYVLVYVPVWMSWVGATFYSNRFDTDDLSQRLITFAQMLTVAGMAASVAEVTAIQFALSVALFRLLLALSYFRAGRTIPAARALGQRMAVVTLITAGIWTVSVFFEGGARLSIWGVAIVFEIGASLSQSTRSRRASMPLHVDHLAERFGLFTIIVLGETVLAVVIGVAHAHWVASAVVFAPIGLSISFSLWWIYFEVVTAKPLKSLGSLRPTAWVFSHAPLAIAITSLGVGIEIAVFTEFGEVLSTAEALILAGSLAVAFLAIGLILTAETRPGMQTRTFITRLPAIGLVVVIGMLAIPAQAVLTGIALVAASQAVVDVRRKRLGRVDAG
jgi:low temperature requirement protein LtrA